MSTIKYIEDYHTIRQHRIYCKYYQNNAPTVIFEAGLGDCSNTWKDIQDNISLITTTFSYDRAGVGKSEATRVPSTGWIIVQDLLNLITKVALKPPFLLVGHSFGGLISRLFASINPANVAGMILIDAAPENKEVSFQKVLTDKQIVKMKNYLNNPDLNSEKVDKVKTYQQISRCGRQFNFPLTIIIRGLAKCYGSGWPEESLLKVEQKLQLDFKKISKISKTIIAKKSSHYIHKDEPELIIKEITKMVNIIKKSSKKVTGLR